MLKPDLRLRSHRRSSQLACPPGVRSRPRGEHHDSPNTLSLAPRAHHIYDRNLTAGSRWPSRRHSSASSRDTPTPCTRSPGARTARASRPRGSIIRSASGMPRPGRKSRNSRDTPSSSWPSRSRPTASRSSREARIIPPRSGIGRSSARPRHSRATRPRYRRSPSSRTASKFAAAAGKSIKIWDLATGQPIKELEGHSGDVQSAAWRGDGGQIATGDKANTIRLWKGRLQPGRRDRDARRGRPRAGLSAQQPAACLGRLGRAGPALAASGRRASPIRRQGTGRRIRTQHAMAPSWQPPAATRSSGSGIRPMANRSRRSRPTSPSSRSRFSKTGQSSRRRSPTRRVRIYQTGDGKEVEED